MSMTNDKRVAALMCFPSRATANVGMQILTDLGYRFIGYPEGLDEADPETTFVEAWKPLSAEADEQSEPDIVFDEIQAAIGHLGDTIETGVFAAHQTADWFRDSHVQ
jgi:hypothetical protein